MSAADTRQENHIVTSQNEQSDPTDKLQSNSETENNQEPSAEEKSILGIVESVECEHGAEESKEKENMDVSEDIKLQPEVAKCQSEMESKNEIQTEPDKREGDAVVNYTSEEVSTGIITESTDNAGSDVKPEMGSEVDSKDNGQQEEMEAEVKTMARLIQEDSEGTKEENVVKETVDHPKDQINETTQADKGKSVDVVEKKEGATDIAVDLKESAAKNEEPAQVNGANQTSRSTLHTEKDLSAPKSQHADSEGSIEFKSTEEISYSTTIVGGVVHRVPINSSSPKAQQRKKETTPSPQSGSVRKKSMIDALFGRLKKSKGGASSDSGDADEKDEEGIDSNRGQTQTALDDKNNDRSEAHGMLENESGEKDVVTDGPDNTHRAEDKPAEPEANTDAGDLAACQSSDDTQQVNTEEEGDKVQEEAKGTDVKGMVTAVFDITETPEGENVEVKESADVSVNIVSVSQETKQVVEEPVTVEVSQKNETKIELSVEENNEAVVTEETDGKPLVEEPKADESKEESSQVQKDKDDVGKPIATAELPSPESDNSTQDEDTVLRERLAKRETSPATGSHSPKAHRMQMRISYAESGGGKEVELIGTPERAPEPANQKAGKTAADHRVPCRALGDADHEGWLSKKGGALFFSSWKRRWVVLKEGKLYYYKTAFDQEAGGVITMEGVTVTTAPETKKNFCFKCEQSGPKTQVALFMAGSQEDMDKWLAVLSAASRGEVIQKPRQKQQHLAVKDGVVMRRKSGSNPTQRTSSVLAVGGRHDILEDEEDAVATKRRSSKDPTPQSPNSQSSSSKSDSDKETAVPTKTTQSSRSGSPGESQPSDSGSGQVAPEEKPATVNEQVFMESEVQMVVESSPPLEQTHLDQEMSADQETFVDAKDSATQSSLERDRQIKEGLCASVVATETVRSEPGMEAANDVEPAKDRTDETVDHGLGEVAVACEEKDETSTKSTRHTAERTAETEPKPTQGSSETTQITDKMTSDELVTETDRPSLQKRPSESESTLSSSSEPVSPSKTKWYFMLDEQEKWSASDDERPKSSDSSTAEESMKSVLRRSVKEEDDLFVMCRNIKEARLSIVGMPLYEGADRVRALSKVHEKGESEDKFVRLKTLERTLKDKQRSLSRLEELLNKEDVNRESLHEWSLRHGDLLEELAPEGGKEESTEKEILEALPEEGGDVEKQGHENVVKNGESTEKTNIELTTLEVKVEETNGGEQQFVKECEGEEALSQMGTDTKEREQPCPEGGEEGKREEQSTNQGVGHEQKLELTEKEQATKEEESKDSRDGETRAQDQNVGGTSKDSRDEETCGQDQNETETSQDLEKEETHSQDQSVADNHKEAEKNTQEEPEQDEEEGLQEEQGDDKNTQQAEEENNAEDTRL